MKSKLLIELEQYITKDAVDLHNKIESMEQKKKRVQYNLRQAKDKLESRAKK